MKKMFFIAFVLLSTSLFAERYMMLLEYNFIDGCSQGSKQKVNKCVCMLSEIEKAVTQAEMIDFSMKAAAGQKIPDKLNAKIMGAAIKCAKK